MSHVASKGFTKFGLGIRVGTDRDAEMISIIRHAFPWLIWLLGLPIAALTLRVARWSWGHPDVLTFGMFVGAALLTWLVWRVSSARGKIAKWHPTLTMATAMGWLTAMTDHPTSLLGVVYLLGGLVGCIAWNVRNSTHSDPIMDVLPRGGDDGRRPSVDVGALVRVIADASPRVRGALEKGSVVVPALAGPLNRPAIEAPSGGKDDKGGKGKVVAGSVLQVNEDLGINPKTVWPKIDHNWRKFTGMPKGRDLNGARLVPTSLSPSRIRAKVLLKSGEMTPKMVEDVRELLAGLMRMPLSSVRVFANPKNHAEAFIDFTIYDRLAKTIVWEGPEPGWRSIGEDPILYGVQEDGGQAHIFQPADPEGGKNLTHMAIEGVNGSGKSETAKIGIVTGAWHEDVVDWVMDPIKNRQTFGGISPLLDWFAITRAEAVSLIEYVVDIVLARAEYLGTFGYSNWVPGCGLPFLRVTLEEGNMIADMLGDALEDVGNTARSAGVGLWGSFQRMHSDKVSTGLRAVFTEAMSFGCKKIGDAFILSDELAGAGADPSVWGSSYPGKHFFDKATWDLERKVLETRAFLPDGPAIEQIARERAEAKYKRVRELFPDWTEILAKVDTAHNGVYSGRTTGTAVRQEMDEALARKAAQKQRAKNGPAKPGPEPKDDPAPAPEPAEEITEEPDEEGTQDMTTQDTEGTERVEADPNLLRREMGKLGVDTGWLAGAADPSADRKPIWMPKPGEVLSFGPPREQDDSGQARARALAHGIAFLATKGPGWRFQPHEWGEACIEDWNKANADDSARSMSWYRGEMRTLQAMGLVEFLPEKGFYRVSPDIRSERAEARVKEMLAKIEGS